MHDCILQGAFRVGARQEGIADAAQRFGVADVVWFVVHEADGQLLCVVEDFLSGAGYVGHLW